MNNNYDQGYYNARYEKLLSDPYNLSNPQHHSKGYKKEMEYVGNVSNKKVLDIGCGLGDFCWLLSNKNAKVTGVDISKDAIAKAKKCYKNKNLNFSVADLTKNVNLKDKFDIIICSHLLEHLDTTESSSLLSNAYKLLEDNGRLIIILPLNEKTIIDSIKRKVSKYIFRKINKIDATHKKTYTIKSLKNELNTCGFKINKWEGLSFQGRIEDLIMHFFFKVPIIGHKFIGAIIMGCTK